MALLCETRLATMTELMDLEGPWSNDLLASMAIEAKRIRARQKRETFVGLVSAIGSFFGDGSIGKDYGAEIDREREEIADLEAIRSGEEPPDPAEKAAEKLAALIERLPGMKGKGK